MTATGLGLINIANQHCTAGLPNAEECDATKLSSDAEAGNKTLNIFL